MAALPNTSRTGPIRVMVVDDSVVVRRIVTGVLDEDPDIEVVTTAANGRIALEKVDAARPDVITLDIEMPELDGIGTLRELRKRHPRLPVIMFSTLTAAGATATLDALSAGANDFVTKPANVGSVMAGMQAVREQLIPKVKTLSGRGATSTAGLLGRRAVDPARPGVAATGTAPAGRVPSRVAVAPTGPRPAAGPPAVLVIGVSTGGPNALAEIWPHLPQLRIPVLVVQHMPPVFTTMLAQRLDAMGTVPMSEGVDGAELRPGQAWLAPGDHHMTIERHGAGHRLAVTQGPPEHSCRPAVDPLFRSAAAAFGNGVVSVVLTGMGSDGALGAEVVRSAGGIVLAQDEASSVVWGMPGAVVTAGLADAVLPLSAVADEITKRVAAPSRATPTAAGVR